jgi:hypothetical protein
MDWEQAATYRQLAEKAEDSFIKEELLDLAALFDGATITTNGKRIITGLWVQSKLDYPIVLQATSCGV